MAKIPDILQGTDGIRGRITNNNELNDLTPLDFYIKNNLLTPFFFEYYTYAFASLLLKTSFAQKGDNIIIGWDPRDQTGDFNQAAINGIRKAGLNAVKVGILPTPAIPLYMLLKKAAASVVLTASHNPSDQNGIKLFLGYTGLKLLPPDDKLLTNIIKDQHRLNLQELQLEGKLEDESEEARRFFIQLSLDPRNSWANNVDFSDTILVLDASKGSATSIIKEVFLSFSFKKLVMTNLQGDINESCGVADIEGEKRIQAEDVIKSGSRFYAYEALRTMFDLSKSEKDIATGKIKLTALIFDGDADRCFRLDYHPAGDELLVSSGDHLGIHQAQYLKTQQSIDTTVFINTVESDLNTAITAKKIGFFPKLTGVGDKWILLQAVLDKLNGLIYNESCDNFAKKLKKESKKSDISGIIISKLWKEYLNQQIQQNPKPQFQFCLGIEESGHSITPSFLNTGTETLRCFAGSGIKSGINSMVAISTLNKEKTPDQWFENLSNPFQAGVKDTFYIYYVNKNKILPKTEFRDIIKNLIKQQFYKIFPSGFTHSFVEFQEEKSMLYCSILENQDQCGAVFIRNSGTEDKAALYLRGEKRIHSRLKQLSVVLHQKLLNGLKNRDSDFVKFEISLLSSVQKGETLDQLFASFHDLPVERILKEIELKEGLLTRKNGKLILTDKGMRFLSDW